MIDNEFVVNDDLTSINELLGYGSFKINQKYEHVSKHNVTSDVLQWSLRTVPSRMRQIQRFLIIYFILVFGCMLDLPGAYSGQLHGVGAITF